MPDETRQETVDNPEYTSENPEHKPSKQPNSQPNPANNPANNPTTTQNHNPTDNSEIRDSILIGTFIYAVTTTALFLTTYFAIALADSDSILLGIAETSQFADQELLIATVGAFETTLFLAPLIAVALTIGFYRSNEFTKPAPTTGTAASTTGATVAGLLLIILLVVFEPEFQDINFGTELPGIIGLVIGTAAAAALTGFLLTTLDNRLTRNIF